MLLFDDPYEQVLETIRDGYPDANKTDLTYDRSGHADFSFRMFRLKKQINTSFDQIASKVTAEILKIPAVRKVAQESGYLNIFLRDEFFLESVDKYLSERKQYPDTFQDPERVLVEHTSTNPTGPIHIGRTRNSIIGDSLARILARYGYRVSTQYFVNDSGKQVAALYKGFKMYHPGEPPAIDSLLSGYQKIYSEIKDDREKEKDLIEPVIKRYESGDSEIIGEIREYCTIVLEGIRKSLSSIGIKIDDYVWESNFLRGTELEAVFEMLDNRLKDENGATYIELDNETKVYLRRSNGTSLYIARDIAYHIFKALNSDWIIDVLGEDHKEHAARLSQILRDFMDFKPRLDVVTYSFMSLEGSRFATRRGNIVSLDDLLRRTEEEALKIVREKRPDMMEEKLSEVSKKVAVSSVRFNIIRVNSSKPVDFKWKEALSFDGDAAPFIMYAYARARRILEKAGEETSVDSRTYLKEERALSRNLYLYPIILQDAVSNLKPELIATYCLDLAKAFNEFYANCPVIGSGPEMGKRIMLTSAFSKILRDAGSLIGIEFLEEM